MAIFESAELRLARGISELALSNPFLPERFEAERAVLGDGYVDLQDVWSIRDDLPEESENVREIARRAEALVESAQKRLAAGRVAGDEELALYEDVALYVLYERHRGRLRDETVRALEGRPHGRWRRIYEPFEVDAAALLRPAERPLPGNFRTEHLFAFFFQIRRAFTHIYSCLVGGSMVGARLRAAVWQSIFTHNPRRYMRSLYNRMGDLNTLVTGPSGTGKELVARAIGLSRYIPFDPMERRFAADFAGSFHAVNLSALSPTLIESELFGHQRGAFTGALADRAGWFEVCGAYGAVFLDEIGEIPSEIQVKLLRVLQSRQCVRLGGTDVRRFEGKAIAATNRDLARELEEGRFREDLYYRLCADTITTPSLSAQLAEAPEDLGRLVRFLAARLVPEDADDLVADVLDWIDRELSANYAWPGNVRELEQCVRNVLVRREYRPPLPVAAPDPLVGALDACGLTAEELLRRYVTIVYAREGSYEAAGRRLGLDRRTVKKKVEAGLLRNLGDGVRPAIRPAGE